VCDACRVVVVEGAENVSEPSPKEVAAMLPPGERLACQVTLSGPATFTTTYW
jgi:ferredoxin